MDFSIIKTRPIIDILIGDTLVLGNYSLPRMSGPNLCELCTQFGYSKSYTWGASNLSRWMYMNELLEFLNKQDRVQDLLSFLFDLSRFDYLKELGDIDRINETHRNIVQSAIVAINKELLVAKKELRIVNSQFVICEIGGKVSIKTPKVNVVTQQYIRDLPDRIKEDLANKDYDSVITKSRTLLEEVLIYIIEQLTKERYKSNGKLEKIYQDATELLNMRPQGDWDKRVNELLSGLHKMVSSIASMRNMNSDAHGVGSSRIEIKEREAILVAHSAMLLSEYWLSVFKS
ncbi:MAG: abortive infection family protein [Bacteroidales bacterium]|nr:abortive infection family protein [Bacteroidales bacterium]MDY4520820.1 abortive infection family protein [Bacteroidales bacterium]